MHSRRYTVLAFCLAIIDGSIAIASDRSTSIEELASAKAPNSLRGAETEKKVAQPLKEDNVINYIDAFARVRKDSYWPLPFSSEESIFSTFGPTVNPESEEYEFHRGLDIFGDEDDPVTAVYPGVVYQITDNEDVGMKEIVIKHRFSEWTQVHSANYNTKSWYSVYANVKTELKDGDEVIAGQVIGQLGLFGEIPHLHFELRVGTTCSLEDGIKDDCVTLGYDPHVHPLLINEVKTGPDFAKPDMEVMTDIGPFTDGSIQISTPISQSNINRYELQIIGSGKKLKKNHVLDLNLREGFDPTSQDGLDAVDESKPYLKPVPFEEENGTWSTEIVIPSTWVENKFPGDWFRLVVQDVWGKSSYLSFTSELNAWCKTKKENGVVQIIDDDCAKLIQ